MSKEIDDLRFIIDSTLLGFIATKEELDKLIYEADLYKFKSVCVSPSNVKYAKEVLTSMNSNCLVCTVVGFPHGDHTIKVKAFETKDAINNGADEIDMVINVSQLKNKDYATIRKEIRAVVKEAKGHTVKVIIESGLLTNQEIKKVVEIIVKEKADFVKTSTGFSGINPDEEVVKLLVKLANGRIKVKVSGGVRTFEDGLKFYNLGASRLGTSKATSIIKGELYEEK
jgi:deoxyribose-phosphate aldolase